MNDGYNDKLGDKLPSYDAQTDTDQTNNHYFGDDDGKQVFALAAQNPQDGHVSALFLNIRHHQCVDKKTHDTLEQTLKRFEELETLLQRQDVVSDGARYQQVATEYARLGKVTRVYRKYKKTRRDEEEVRKMLEDERGELREMAEDELRKLQETQASLEKELSDLLYAEEEGIDRSAIMEIRAGTGGDEAALFAADLRNRTP